MTGLSKEQRVEQFLLNLAALLQVLTATTLTDKAAIDGLFPEWFWDPELGAQDLKAHALNSIRRLTTVKHNKAIAYFGEPILKPRIKVPQLRNKDSEPNTRYLIEPIREIMEDTAIWRDRRVFLGEIKRRLHYTLPLLYTPIRTFCVVSILRATTSASATRKCLRDDMAYEASNAFRCVSDIMKRGLHDNPLILDTAAKLGLLSFPTNSVTH